MGKLIHSRLLGVDSEIQSMAGQSKQWAKYLAPLSRMHVIFLVSATKKGATSMRGETWR